MPCAKASLQRLIFPASIRTRRYKLRAWEAIWRFISGMGYCAMTGSVCLQRIPSYRRADTFPLLQTPSSTFVNPTSALSAPFARSASHGISTLQSRKTCPARLRTSTSSATSCSRPRAPTSSHSVSKRWCVGRSSFRSHSADCVELFRSTSKTKSSPPVRRALLR